MQHKTRLHLLLIALSYIILIVAVYPVGNFPINDDWAYARSVLSWAEDGEFHLLDWGAMTLISQVLWGALWVKLFGFSFDVLRYSTIFLGLVALLGSYYLLLSVSKEAWIALTGTFVLLVNPMFMVPVNSFMTDVPFLAMSLWSVFFLIRAIERDSISDIIIGMGFAIVALLIRQLALALPLAFLFGYAARFSQHISIRRMIICVTPFALSNLIYVAYIKWLILNDNLPRALSWSQDRLNTNFIALFDNTYSDLAYICRSVGGMLLYMGLFTLPMMLALYLRRGDDIFPRLKKLPFWIMTGIFCVAITLTLFGNDILMPVHGNLLTNWGIGPFTLRDFFALKLPYLDLIPHTVLQLITALSVLGALLMSYGLAISLLWLFQNQSGVWRDRLVAHWQEIFLWILMAAYIFPLLLTDYFDRYLLFLLPFVFALVAMRNRYIDFTNRPLLKLTSIVLIPVYGVFSVALTHDYMSWNRTRLQATDWVIKEYNIGHSSVDSGFEFNGFYGYNPEHDNDHRKWVRDDKYMISFGEVPGFQSVKRFGVERTLAIGPREILVLKRLQ